MITGGCGFIGSAMTKLLLDSGRNVRVFDLSEQVDRYPPPMGAEIYRGSILDINDVTNAIRDCTHVVHLVAKLGVGVTEARRLECLNINIHGTTNILDACVRDNIEKIVFSSSSEVYGEQQIVPIMENNPLNPKSVYAVTKLAGEEYLRAYQQRYDLDYSIVRFFNVYGPRQVAEFVMPRFIKNVMENKSPTVYGEGNQIRAFCYVDDAVQGMYLALFSKKSNSKTYNIGNDTEPITMIDLARKVASVLKKDIEPEIIPFHESDRTSEREIISRLPSISKAKRELDYAPHISLSDGIIQTAKFGQINDTWSNPAR